MDKQTAEDILRAFVPDEELKKAVRRAPIELALLDAEHCFKEGYLEAAVVLTRNAHLIDRSYIEVWRHFVHYAREYFRRVPITPDDAKFQVRIAQLYGVMDIALRIEEQAFRIQEQPKTS